MTDYLETRVDGFKFTWDYNAEAGYLHLGDEDKLGSETLSDVNTSYIFDFSEDDDLLGIEFLDRDSLPGKLKQVVEDNEQEKDENHLVECYICGEEVNVASSNCASGADRNPCHKSCLAGEE